MGVPTDFLKSKDKELQLLGRQSRVTTPQQNEERELALLKSKRVDNQPLARQQQQQQQKETKAIERTKFWEPQHL